MTEADLRYYDLVETLWLGGFGTTIERIHGRTRPQEPHISHLDEGLRALVERKWLKVQQIPIGTWGDETVYETWYIPFATRVGNRGQVVGSKSRATVQTSDDALDEDGG